MAAEATKLGPAWIACLQEKGGEARVVMDACGTCQQYTKPRAGHGFSVSFI